MARLKTVKVCPNCGRELRVEDLAVLHYDVNPQTGRLRGRPRIDCVGDEVFVYCLQCGTLRGLDVHRGRVVQQNGGKHA